MVFINVLYYFIATYRITINRTRCTNYIFNRLCFLVKGGPISALSRGYYDLSKEIAVDDFLFTNYILIRISYNYYPAFLTKRIVTSIFNWFIFRVKVLAQIVLDMTIVVFH